MPEEEEDPEALVTLRHGSASAYYKSDIRVLSYREARAIASPVQFVGFVFHKLFSDPNRGISITSITSSPDSLGFLRWEDLSDVARAALETERAALEGLGFRLEFIFTVPCLPPQNEAFTLVFLDPSATTIAEIDYVRRVIFKANDKVLEVRPWLNWRALSQTTNEQILLTTNVKAMMLPPPGIVLERRPKASLIELVEYHLERVAESLVEGSPHRRSTDLVAFNRSSVADFVLGLIQRNIEFLSARGVLVRLDDAELERLQPTVATVATPAPPAPLSSSEAKTFVFWSVLLIALVLALATIL